MNSCAITGFIGTQMEESKRLQTGGSAEFEVGEKQCREFVSCLINCMSFRFQLLFLVGAAKAPQDFDRRYITSELASIKRMENSRKDSI